MALASVSLCCSSYRILSANSRQRHLLQAADWSLLRWPRRTVNVV